jgi:hypothetical protein
MRIREDYMPDKEVKHPDKPAATGSYSAPALRDGGSLDLRSGQPVPGNIEEETRRTLGTYRESISRCRSELCEPARTTVQSVLWGGPKVEIDVVAKVAER